MVKKGLCRKVVFFNEDHQRIGAVCCVIDTGSSLSLLNSNLDILKRVAIEPMDKELVVMGAFGENSEGPKFLGVTTILIKLDGEMRSIRFTIVNQMNHGCIIGNPDITKLGLVIRDGTCYSKDNEEIGYPLANKIRVLNPDTIPEDKYISFFIEEKDTSQRENLTLVGRSGVPFDVPSSYMQLPAEEAETQNDLKLYDCYEDFVLADGNLDRFSIPTFTKRDPKVKETLETMWKTNKFDISSEASTAEKSKLKRLLDKFQGILSVGNSIGCVPPSIGIFKQKFNIEEPTPAPIYRPKTPEHCEIMHQEIMKLERLGVISKIKTDIVTTNMLVIPKPTVPPTMRVVLDLRRINRWSDKMEFPIPKIHGILRKLNMANFFNCIDLSSAYFSIQVCRSQRHWYTILDPKTSQVYAFDRMPQGHKNAPAFFQKFAAQTLKPGLEDKLEVYLDDCNTKSETVEEAIEILETIFERCLENNLRVNLKKLKLASDSVSCFGFIISRHGLRANPDRVKALRESKMPNDSKKSLKSSIAALNYYRNMIRNFASIAQPLYQLTSDKVKFVWTETHTNGWKTLINRLCESILLVNIEDDAELYLETDASNHGTGAVLYQWIGQEKRIIEIHSQGLNGSESLWAISQLELKAIYVGLSKFENYIGNRRINLICDNTSVYFLLSAGIDKVAITRKSPSARFLLFISCFDYTIQHVSGKADSFLLADLASRLGKDCSGKYLTLGPNSKGPLITFEELETQKLPVEGKSQKSVPPEKVFSIDVEKLTHKLQPQEQGSKILERLKLAQLDCKTVRELVKAPTSSYEVQDGILFKKFPSGRALVCPAFYTAKFLEQIHRHESARRLIERINAYGIFIYNKYKSVLAFLDNCSVCAPARSKPTRAIVDASVTIPSEPMSTIHVDIWMIGASTSVLIIVDSFSRFIDNRILKEPSADEVLRNIIMFVSIHGIPKIIVSDNGAQFTSEKFEEFCKSLGILQKRSAPGNSRGNSIAEFQISRTQTLLRTYQPPRTTEFGIYLAVITFMLNTQPQTKLKLSAFEILYGRTSSWIQQCPDLSKTKQESLTPALKRLYSSMNTSRQAVIDRAYEKRRKLEPKSPRKVPSIPVVGDHVRLKKFNYGKNFIKKFFRPYSEETFKVKSKSPHTKLLLLEEIVDDPAIRPKQLMRHARAVRKVRKLQTSGEKEDPELGNELMEIDETKEETLAKNHSSVPPAILAEPKPSEKIAEHKEKKVIQRKQNPEIKSKPKSHGMTLRERKRK